MNKTCINIYKSARESSGLTQECAAGKLNISSRTLSAYENDRIPPEDIVDKMIELYGFELLAYKHLQMNTLIGQKYLPKINFDDLSINVLRFQKEYSDIEKIKLSMIEIACDGQIDNHEKEGWSIVTKELSELVSAGLALMYTQKANKGVIV